MKTYLDTSALAKWYINEPQSDEVEVFIQANAPLLISTLTRVELRCLLARRRRNGDFDATHENRIFAAFESHIYDGYLVVAPVQDELMSSAIQLIAQLPEHPLRTLDALHLAIARSFKVISLATADRTMAAAAGALELETIRFD